MNGWAYGGHPAANGIIAYARPSSMMPIDFKSSWTQRMRWTKGFTRCSSRMMGDLFHGGSGWMVSERIIKGMHGWDFHTLTEDIQFSTFCCANNIQIGIAFFDEQPLTSRPPGRQRMSIGPRASTRCSSYNRDLIRGIGKGQFASYDMLMTIAPGMILTLLSFFINAAVIVGEISELHHPRRASVAWAHSL